MVTQSRTALIANNYQPRITNQVAGPKSQFALEYNRRRQGFKFNIITSPTRHKRETTNNHSEDIPRTKEDWFYSLTNEFEDRPWTVGGFRMWDSLMTISTRQPLLIHQHSAVVLVTVDSSISDIRVPWMQWNRSLLPRIFWWIIIPQLFADWLLSLAGFYPHIGSWQYSFLGTSARYPQITLSGFRALDLFPRCCPPLTGNFLGGLTDIRGLESSPIHWFCVQFCFKPPISEVDSKNTCWLGLPSSQLGWYQSKTHCSIFDIRVYTAWLAVSRWHYC